MWNSGGGFDGGFNPEQQKMFQMMMQMMTAPPGAGGGKGGGKGGGGGGGKGKVDRPRRDANRASPGGEAKLNLNNAVLKIVAGRPEGGDLKQGEITYTTNEVAGGWQSQVVITALPNTMKDWNFVGHPSPTEKAAIESASTVALESIMGDQELKELHDRAKRPRVQAIGDDGMPLPKISRGGGDDTPKAHLNNAILKIISGRPEGGSLKKGEISYITKNLGPGQYQSQVIISCLPNHFANVPFAGEVCPSEKDSIHSAAQITLDAIMSDAQLKDLHDRAKEPRGMIVKSEEKCKLFLYSKCKRGADCRFSHDP